MELLRKSKDPIYIDGLISEILSQTQFGTVQLVKEYTVDVATTIWRHLPSLPSLPTMTSFSDINFNALPRSRPIFINFVILVFTYFLCRRFRVNYFIVVFFAVFYFLYEYLDNECHRVCIYILLAASIFILKIVYLIDDFFIVYSESNLMKPLNLFMVKRKIHA